ncbi:MAG: amidohydrolase [Bacteroidales bacterium]|nr:amidohydrolase [Bacteroidales bacterium]
MKFKYAPLPLILLIIIITQPGCNSMKYADLILLNGKIVTVNKEFAICEGVAISDNKIMAAGTNGEMRKLSGNKTQIVDLKGRTVIPGLIDSHLHPESASVSELETEIPDVHTIEQLLNWIRSSAINSGSGSWVILQKFFPTRLIEMRQPTLAELDSVAPDHPVFLNGSFGGMINSKAMQLSGITSETSDPGVIKDNRTGAPTGFIRSSAFALLKVPRQRELSPAEREKALVKMLARYNQYGLTSLISGTGSPESLKMYRNLADRKMLTTRISLNMLLPEMEKVTRESVTEMVKKYNGITTADGDEWVRIGSLKVFLDGGILTGTAFMKEPWGTKAVSIFGIEDPDYLGVVNFTRQELADIVSVANEYNWSFTAHATGEASVERLLDVYDEVNRKKSIKERRFSIIHGNFFSDESIKKMMELGVYANLQPAWFYKDSEAMEMILGSEKIIIFHPYRTMTDAGVMINGGSDHMVKWDATSSINPYNPFLAMWTMVTRTTERGNQITASEALAREEALKAYTINNAYASFEESIKGSIEPGKLADLVVLSDDILTCPEDKIKEIKSLLTILDGKVIYTSPVNF